MPKKTPYKKLESEIEMLKREKARLLKVEGKRTKVKQTLSEKARLKKEISNLKYGKYKEAGKRVLTSLSAVGKALAPKPSARAGPAVQQRIQARSPTSPMEQAFATQPKSPTASGHPLGDIDNRINNLVGLPPPPIGPSSQPSRGIRKVGKPIKKKLRTAKVDMNAFINSLPQ